MASTPLPWWRLAGAAAGLVLFVLVSTLGLAVASGFAARDGGGVGVVFAPGIGTEEAISRVLASGALPLRIGARANVAIARVDGAGTVAALYRAGAWLVFGGAVGAGCGASGASSRPADLNN